MTYTYHVSKWNAAFSGHAQDTAAGSPEGRHSTGWRPLDVPILVPSVDDEFGIILDGFIPKYIGGNMIEIIGM